MPRTTPQPPSGALFTLTICRAYPRIIADHAKTPQPAITITFATTTQIRLARRPERGFWQAGERYARALLHHHL